jgi:hypothetical protein
VKPVDIMSNRPWSEDLLDYLASDFAQGGFDMKRLLATIANSSTYQSVAAEPHVGPAVNFVFRGPVPRRLTAEQFVDSVWTITGSKPAKRDANVNVPRESTVDAPPPLVRASLVKSTMLMRALGRPNREQVVTTRPADLSTLQALELNNGKEFVGLLNKGAERLQAVPAEERIRSLFLQCLCRLPSSEEVTVALDILEEDEAGQGTVDLLWMIFMLPEFQFVN